MLECATMNGLPCDGQTPLDVCLYMEGTQQSSTHKLLHSVTLYFSRSIDQEPQWIASHLTPCALLIVYNYVQAHVAHAYTQACRRCDCFCSPLLAPMSGMRAGCLYIWVSWADILHILMCMGVIIPDTVLPTVCCSDTYSICLQRHWFRCSLNVRVCVLLLITEIRPRI